MRQRVGGRGDCEAALDVGLGETVQRLVVVANIHVRPVETEVEKGSMRTAMG